MWYVGSRPHLLRYGQSSSSSFCKSTCHECCLFNQTSRRLAVCGAPRDTEPPVMRRKCRDRSPEESMEAFSDRFPAWENFPKGLRVMVVDGDRDVLHDLKRKLEACDFIASAFSSESEALDALRDPQAFHVALVEATSRSDLDGFKIVAAAKHLPTIMMANTQNMGIIMRGIAAGASEFLQKPLSEEKLKSIWQHVVKKALSGDHESSPSSDCTTDPKVKKDTEVAGGNGVVPIHPISPKPEQELLCFAACQLDQPRPALSCRGARAEDASEASYRAHEGRELVDDVDNYVDSEDFFQLSSDVATGDNSSSVLKELLDCELHHQNSSDEDILLSPGSMLDPASYGDYHSNTHATDPTLCHYLNFMHGSFDAFSETSELIEGDMLSLSEGGSFLNDSNQGPLEEDAGFFDYFDGDADSALQEADEEALLLKEVSKAEYSMVTGTSSCSHSQSQNSCSKTDCGESGRNGRKSTHGKKKVDWTPELHRRFVQAVEQLGVDKAIPSRILELMGVKFLTRHNIASHLQKFRSHRKHLLTREFEQTKGTVHRASPPSMSCVTSTWGILRISILPQLHVWGHPARLLDSWPGWVPRFPLEAFPSNVVNISSMDPSKRLCNPYLPKKSVDVAINEVLRNPFAPLPIGLKPPSLESVVSELQMQGIAMSMTSPS